MTEVTAVSHSQLSSDVVWNTNTEEHIQWSGYILVTHSQIGMCSVVYVDARYTKTEPFGSVERITLAPRVTLGALTDGDCEADRWDKRPPSDRFSFKTMIQTELTYIDICVKSICVLQMYFTQPSIQCL